jgi:hypothetical protein
MNEWWAVKRVSDGFIFIGTYATSQRGAREAFLALWDHENAPNTGIWRNWREGRHGLDRHEVVRIEAVEVAGDE